MISDEGQLRAARIMRDAADSAQAAASIISEATHQITMLLADGYGGNGIMLLEALRQQNAAPQGNKAGASQDALSAPSSGSLPNTSGPAAAAPVCECERVMFDECKRDDVCCNIARKRLCFDWANKHLPEGITRQDVCVWTQDGDGPWNTSCGVTWEFNDGGPEDNKAHFCHHCGGVLLAEAYDYGE